MNARYRTVIAVGLVAAAMVGCAKKKPQTQAPPPPAPAESVEPAPVTDPTRDATESDLPSDIQELNAELARRGLLGDVYFAFDRSNLDDAARERLARNADFLKGHPELLVTVEGHCDERGTNEYNLALGDRRAASAKEYVLALGVPGDRLRSMSYGEERPQCTASDAACWSRYRRARFLVSGWSGGC